MKNVCKILGCLAVLTMIFSCESVLDIKPTNQANDLLLWSNQDMVLTYTANFYSQLNSGFRKPYASGLSPWLLADITDDADASNPTMYAGPYKFFTGAFDASSSPIGGFSSIWEKRYEYIRRANVFLSHIDKVPGDKDLNQRMKGEIMFLRAYYYFDLIRWYGGVPIITKVETKVDSSVFHPRNTLEECRNFIIDQLAYVADSCLPLTYRDEEFGRITKGAALAMMCRVQLYAGRWSDAAATAQRIRNLGVYGLQPTYEEVFDINNKQNSEIILSVTANDNGEQKGHSFDHYTQPPTFGGRAYTCPTQNLVNAYEMQANGLPITNLASGYDPQNPYVGRDPRFYATVLYDGAEFKGRKLQMYTGGYDVTAGGGIRARYLTNTGYYLRKFVDEDLDLFADPHVSYQNWIMFRYAGILLDYAEAYNEAVGPDQSVYAAVDSIRNRAGMPDLKPGLSKAEMRQAIHHERRVEMAFEGHRYWDVRRWKKAETLFSSSTNPIKKMVITLDPTTGKKTYKVEDLSETRTFLSRQYLFPIPQDELNKPGNKMTQNPGW